MVVSGTGTALRVNQCKPVAVQVGIEVITTQWGEALCVLYIKGIAHRWDTMERIEILCCTLTAIRIQGWLYQYDGITQSLHDIGIFSGREVISCQHRGIGSS